MLSRVQLFATEVHPKIVTFDLCKQMRKLLIIFLWSYIFHFHIFVCFIKSKSTNRKKAPSTKKYTVVSYRKTILQNKKIKIILGYTNYLSCMLQVSEKMSFLKKYTAIKLNLKCVYFYCTLTEVYISTENSEPYF